MNQNTIIKNHYVTSWNMYIHLFFESPNFICYGISNVLWFKSQNYDTNIWIWKTLKMKTYIRQFYFPWIKIKIVLYFLIYKSYMKVNESGFKMKKKKNKQFFDQYINTPSYIFCFLKKESWSLMLKGNKNVSDFILTWLFT